LEAWRQGRRSVFVGGGDGEEVPAVAMHALPSDECFDDGRKGFGEFQAPEVEDAHLATVAVFESVIVYAIFGDAMRKAVRAEGYVNGVIERGFVVLGRDFEDDGARI